jgi:hypothetical protein
MKSSLSSAVVGGLGEARGDGGTAKPEKSSGRAIEG